LYGLKAVGFFSGIIINLKKLTFKVNK